MPRPARPRIEWRDVDGILLLEKPVGLSSNQALQRARRLYRAAKAGHTGSLDPLADGVLPLCFGQATKVAGLLLDSDKTYRAVLALGSRTATGDREGEVLERLPVPALTQAQLARVQGAFTGELKQVPPMYSALKQGGQALYALARQGIEVERAPRAIRILSLALKPLDATRLEITVTCSKGTYIRTLGEDLARALGTCGHLEALTRTEVGAFAGRIAYPLEELEQSGEDEASLDARLLPVDVALGDYPRVVLGAEEARRYLQGQPVLPEGAAAGGGAVARACRVYADGGRFLGLGTPEGPDGRIRASRVMCD